MDSFDQKKMNTNSDLGSRVRHLRKAAGYSLRQLSDVCGISFSTISKIENNQLSPTYDRLLKLANGLRCDIVNLFYDSQESAQLARRSVTRKGQGLLHKTVDYDYELLCHDLVYKKITPLRVTIRARSVRQFGNSSSHEGEEIILVLSGTVEVQTEHYQPEILHEGDCMYLDSTMEHACLNKGEKEAVVFWLSSSPAVEEKISAIKTFQSVKDAPA